MFELTINDAVYQFNFGMGFLREINKRLGKPIDGIPGEKENVGAQFRIAGVIAGECEALADVLEVANKGFSPRVTKQLIDEYIDTVEDIDALFESVIGFLQKANATKKITMNLLKEYNKAMGIETE
jgi:hypothetical protein